MENLLTHNLNEYLPKLACHHSTRSLGNSQLYIGLKNEIERLLSGIEYATFTEQAHSQKKEFYRAIAWNIERGKELDGILHAFKSDAEMNQADLILLTETDIGMARTQNRNVACEIAREMKMNYFFSPAYLNLCKGNSIEENYEAENILGLHGNALLSRYPIENLRTVALKNCKDKMRGSEKRIGRQQALICDVIFPFRTVSVIVAHLDAHSSHKQRAKQMKTILEEVKDSKNPILLGGDLNTSTYNASHAFFAFLGFWNKVLRGVHHVIDYHYPYPERYFEKPLFQVFKDYDFEYEEFNQSGAGTLHYRIEDIKKNSMVQEVVPKWCRRVMEETLRRHGGEVSLKLDWFASRGLRPSLNPKALKPKVLSLNSKWNKDLSDHDPILLDFEIYN